MEMVEEQILPGKLELILRIRAPEERSQRRILLRIEHQLLITPNSLFRVRLRSQHPAVIFEIKFVLPCGHFEIWKLPSQIGEEFFGGAELNLREDCVRIPKAICPIKHRPSRATAMVSDSVQVKHLRRIGNLGPVN